jgi:TRAP-type C4-dicarboxylate transport system permease large subunit
MFLVAAAMVSAWLITVANLPAKWWRCCSPSGQPTC